MPNALAKEGIGIKSIELDSKSDNIVVKSDPVFSGMDMNFDLSFKTKGDYAKYKVVVKNDTDTDYRISEDTSFNVSEYITYKYDVSNELKAKSESIVYVTITYSKEVESSKLVNSKYTELNKAVVQLLDKDGNVVKLSDIKNPKTGYSLSLLVMVLLVVVSVVLLLFNRKKSVKYMSILLIGGLLSVPVLVCAVETLVLTINVKVEILESYPVKYVVHDTIKTSEKENYEIFDSMEYGFGNTCSRIQGQTGYEVCSIVSKTEYHSPGENVSVPTEVKFHVFNGEGRLIENNLLMDGSLQTGVWDYISMDQYGVPYSRMLDINSWWAYFKEINNYDDINEMNFTGNINNHWSDSSRARIDVISPNSFTMPRHEVTFSLSGQVSLNGTLPLSPEPPH